MIHHDVKERSCSQHQNHSAQKRKRRGRKWKPPIAADGSTVLVLNDDGLLEIFIYMDLLDLCAVADCYSRFRQNAKDCFGHTKKTDSHFPLDFPRKIQRDPNSSHFVSEKAKVFRNFGEFFVDFTNDRSNPSLWDPKDARKCDCKLMELSLLHCTENLTSLHLMRFFSDEIARSARSFAKAKNSNF